MMGLELQRRNRRAEVQILGSRSPVVLVGGLLWEMLAAGRSGSDGREGDGVDWRGCGVRLGMRCLGKGEFVRVPGGVRRAWMSRFLISARTVGERSPASVWKCCVVRMT